MRGKENGFWLMAVIFTILISTKIWIKLTFEIQMIGLALLIFISWSLKVVIFKKIKAKYKKDE